MPSGLTYDLYKGTEQSFEEFAWRCARQMGALVLMRDEAPDAPIPERFEPQTSFYDEAIAKAEELLSELEGMSLEEAGKRAEEEYEDVRQVREQANRVAAERRSRYEAMLAQVEEWTPPTPDHVGLKELMVDQLNESIRFDCWTTEIEKPRSKKTPSKWLQEKKERAQRDLVYHREQRADEIQRTEDRNRWLAELRESLAKHG